MGLDNLIDSFSVYTCVMNDILKPILKLTLFLDLTLP